MSLKKLDYGQILLKVLRLVILEPLLLPFNIYKNALVKLSNSKAEDSEERNLSDDFPLYIWFLGIFNAIIVLTYPLGIVLAIITAIYAYGNGFSIFLMIIIYTYFAPLAYGLIREIYMIPLKGILYLKLISKK